MAEFLSRPFPPRPKISKMSPPLSAGDVARLMGGEGGFSLPNPATAARKAYMENAAPPTPRPPPFGGMLPFLIGAVSFLLGSGIGLGWLLRGWFGGESSPKKLKAPKGTSDTPLEGIEMD